MRLRVLWQKFRHVMKEGTASIFHPDSIESLLIGYTNFLLFFSSWYGQWSLSRFHTGLLVCSFPLPVMAFFWLILKIMFQYCFTSNSVQMVFRISSVFIYCIYYSSFFSSLLIHSFQTRSSIVLPLTDTERLIILYALFYDADYIVSHSRSWHSS
jgi:hypothetical protein